MHFGKNERHNSSKIYDVTLIVHSLYLKEGDLNEGARSPHLELRTRSILTYFSKLESGIASIGSDSMWVLILLRPSNHR